METEESIQYIIWLAMMECAEHYADLVRHADYNPDDFPFHNYAEKLMYMLKE